MQKEILIIVFEQPASEPRTSIPPREDIVQKRILFKRGYCSKEDIVQKRILFKRGYCSKEDII
jgi:hypothetical protein